MTRSFQEFFWTPNDIIAWLGRIVADLHLWLVIWCIDNDARLIDVNDLMPEMFNGLSEDTMQLFLGSSNISGTPVWQTMRGKRLLDFSSSYAVQLDPPIMIKDRQILLQGRIAILGLDAYKDSKSATKLASLFQTLRSNITENSDHNRVIVQSLTGGRKKIWKDILVGKTVSDSKGITLKQFVDGEVCFHLAARF